MQNKNNNLLLGVSISITIISLAGFLIMTGAYYQKSQELTKAFQNKTVNNVNGGQNANGKVATVDPSNIKVTDQDHIRGNKNAPITIFEFSDLECPYCAAFHQTMQEIIQKNPNVRWVFKDFPLSAHPFGRTAALAAEAAGEQGKFWEYADALYANQDKFTDSYFAELAQTLRLDMAKFNQSFTSEKFASKVDDDQALGAGLGIIGTPTSFINGQKIVGAQSVDYVQQLIDNLKK